MINNNVPMNCGIATLSFTVMGETVGQGRPRFSNRGGVTRAYEPKKSAEEKAVVRLVAQQAMEEQGWNLPSPEMPIMVEIVSYRKVPKSKQRWYAEAARLGLVVPLNKSDLDNCEKLYLDAMNGIVYPDDKQIFELRAVKLYSDQPRTEVKVTGYYQNYGDIRTIANATAKNRREREKKEADNNG